MADLATIQSSAAIQSAYGRAQSVADKLGQMPTAARPGHGQDTDFAQMVANAASDAVQTVRRGDATALAGLQDRADLQQVVEATMAMESTVRVSVALRDKLVEAYQEILRMPI